jgi:hypothetical protein
MTGYLEWLQPQLATRPTRWRARWETLRAEQQAGLTNHARHPEMYAHLVTGWETFLAFAVEVGALTRAEANRSQQEGGEFIASALNRQRIDDAAEDPVQRFLGILREAFAQKRVYLDSTEGDRPVQGEQWGWVRMPVASNDGKTAERLQPGPNAALLGWIAEDFLYLMPDAAYRLAFTSLQQAGTMLIPQTTLWKRLVQEGYLRPGKGRYTILKRIQSERIHVLALGRENFLHTDPLISESSGDSGDNEKKI